MNTTTQVIPSDRWPLSRVLILVLAGGFVGLMVDIRVEHVDAVRTRSIAWLPIDYAGFMTIACVVASVRWNKAARLIMPAFFGVAIFIGGVGFYLHNHGNLKEVAKTSINAWIDPDASHSDDPPQFAPLAFAGLGAIGLLASLKRFNS